jgi:hypothetical protein
MKFYCLHEGIYEGVQQRPDQLEAVCNKKQIEFIPLNSLTTDYKRLPLLTKTDLLYNCARGSQALESLLLNSEVTSFYVKNPQLNLIRSTTDWSIIHDKIGLPSPKTIYHLTADRVLLKLYIEYLEGFPVILKIKGGTRGIGTIKIESWQSLVSTVGYLVTKADPFIMRQFTHQTMVQGSWFWVMKLLRAQNFISRTVTSERLQFYRCQNMNHLSLM